MTQIVVKGRHARERVLVALAKEFPGRVPETLVKIDRTPPPVERNQETKMVNQAALAKLDKNLTELEREIDAALDKQSRRNPVDDWSDTPTGNANAAANAAADNGDDTDLDDDEDADDNEDLVDKRLAKATKFEAMVDKIANERGLSKAKAMVIVRREFPDIFAGYQESAGVSKSYRARVEAEIAKGCSVDVACQKIGYAYPGLARAGIAKAAASPAEFMAKVDVTIQASGCSRTEAMQQVRKRFPSLFAKFQNV